MIDFMKRERIRHRSLARAGPFRSILARRRMLRLPDNARDGDHIRDLLPDHSECVVLATSRRQLGSPAAFSAMGRHCREKRGGVAVP